MAGSTRNPWEENYNTEGDSASGGKPWEQSYQEPEKPKDPGILRKAGDLGLSVAKGIVAVPEAAVGLADIPTGGRVGKFLENEGGAFGFRTKQAKEYLASMQSDDLQGKQQQFQQADGIIDKAGVALSNPSLIANAVAESVPLMGAGAVPARAIMAVAPKVGAVAAGAIGEGAVGAGSAAEAIRQETGDGLLTPAQSGLAAATGAATSAFGFAGGKLAQRMGIGDVDTMLTQGAIKTTGAPSAKSIPRQVVEGAIAEGWLEELPQSVSEQVLQNLALNKPWHEGVDDAAVMGTLSGMAMGGAAAGASGFSARGPQPADQQPPTQPPAPAPDAGPTLALPAPDRGVIQVGPDGTARTLAYQAPGYVGDVTDVEPRAIDPVRAAVESAANDGGALSGAALTAIDSGASSAMQPVAPDAAPPAPISLEEADARDQAAYEQFYASHDADPVVGRYFEDDNDIPDFDAASNASDEDFLRSLGATDEDIQDAIATSRQPTISQSGPAVDAGAQANEPAGTRQGAGTDQAAQGQVDVGAIQQAAAAAPVPAVGGRVGDDGARGATTAVPDGVGNGRPGAGPASDDAAGAAEPGAARPGGRGDGNPELSAPTNLRDALVRLRAQKQEAANAQATKAPVPGATAVPGTTTAAALEADGRAPDIKPITAKQIPDMTDAELQQAIAHYGPDHKRTAKLQKEVQRRAATVSPTTEGTANVPQADQAQQTATQPTQAGAAQPTQGLTDAAPAENNGAQAAPAAGPQGSAPAAESAEQRTQRVAQAGEAWTRMPTAQREALAGIAAGLNPIQRKRVPSAAWADLNRDIQRKLADAMDGRAETGGDQAAAPTAEGPISNQTFATGIDQQAPTATNTVAQEEKPEPRNGEVGGKYKAGEVVVTSSGRTTAPFPKVDTSTNGKANNTILRVNRWLIGEALAEAQSRGDDFNERQFQAVNNLNPSQSDKDSAEEYLFGEQPAVVPSILKPLVGANESASTPTTSPGVVNVPPAIAEALDADMQAQKARITRLRNAAAADGQTLEQKKTAQTQLKGAEFVLQKMRTTRFDAEDAALNVIEQKDMAAFADHIAFPRAEKALQELIGAAQAPAPAAAPAKPTPKKKPSADQTRAKADLMAALADLGDILGKNARMNIMPEQEQKLLPVLTRVLDAAFRLGYARFKDAAKFALDQIRTHLGDEAADALTLDHLQGAYIAMAGGKQGTDTKRAVIDVETKAEIEAHEVVDPDAREAAEESAPADAAAKSLTDALYQTIRAGGMPKDNPALKKLVEAFDEKPADQARMKQAQEELETAIAMSARDIVAKGQSDKATFDELLRLYDSQPNLNIRTSTSVANQAYSTPAPLAFLASRLAGITRNTVTHEPTGGTGMLLIGADPKKALVNELNDLRISALKAQGFAPTQLDAATMRLVPEGTRPDAVVTNPPFGSVKDAEGKPVKVKVDGFSIGQIDHLIAARALETMKDDGKATLILGANKVAGGLSTDDRIFFNWLYSHYNVAGHFEVDGDLYARQGAGWPVRVITINGRQKSGKLAPVAGTIQRADNWSQVYEQFTQSISSASQSAAAKPADGTGERAPVSAAAPAAPGGSRPQGSTGSAGNVAGARPRVVPDSAKPAAEPVGPVPDEQRLNAESFVPQPQPGQEPAGAQRPSKPAGTTAVADAPAAAGNEFQSPYVPRSARKDDGVLIPSNMAQPTQDALNRLEDSVGDIDEFARSELGYATVADLHNALMGLQVDSVATAIYQIKQNKAVVIADQTGIGKGRQAASIIRWAARNGMTPVFVSVKPSLFTDMYGDLADIGTHDVAPFILNSSEWVSGTDGEKLFANKPSTHRAAIQSIVDNAALPQGRNALFMTYSQINTANLQRQALMALAPNAVFVLDESHNAAGDSGTGEFMISVLKEARGVTYLSATYAKRPDNMPLYFKTDIGDAAADSEGLADAMAAGGLPLQTVVSNNLVKAGQMFRRERSYDGVSIASTFDTANRQLHERLSDEATEALRAIVSADKLFHSVFVKSMDKALKAEGSQVQDNAGNQVSAGVQHTEFSSVVHNFVRQMLLGLKAQTAADEAIASLKRGEKPIIAVENTMGSFLSEYAAQNNINQGDSLGAFDYRTVLSRALERSRVINVVLPNGDKSKKNIALSELDPITRKAYDQAQAVIDGLAIDIPVSPIDWMRAEIIRAGFTVAEITGRDLSVDYSNPRKPVLSAIDLAEQKDKVASTRRFNGGELDALILNVAGSTGISLHASEKFADQRQRHMIVAQAAGDINIFMQMLGRVHRTGQVRLPKYTILSVDLPTEKRPTAVLSRKMKSLNANTSSNTESATSVKTADILNKYGDQIVNQYLVDNLDLARQLGVDDLLSSDGERVSDDIARKATGRLALQPIEVQRAFYEDVEAQYDALIEYLNKTNQNDLEPRTFDFDAKEVRSEILFDGPNKTTPFGEDAVYGEYSIKAQGAPMKPAEIRAAMAENLGGLEGVAHANKLVNDVLQTYADQINAAREKAGVTQATFDEDKYATLMKSLYGDAGDGYVQDAKAKIANGIPLEPFTIREVQGLQGVGPGLDFIRSHAIGTTFRVDINSEPYNAVVTNVRSTHKTTGNPFSLSKIQLTVAVNGALRSITVPATQFRSIEVSSIARTFTVESLFKEQPPNQRETAKIVTGNLLAAYGEIKGVRGTIISFTKADGVIEQGILLPKLFDFSKNTQGDYRLRSGADALKFLQQSTNKDIGRFGIATRDGLVRVLPRGDGVQVRVPKSKAQGARYFLDKNLIAAAGDFVSTANAMVANVDDAASAAKVLDLLMDKQALYALPSMADEAKSMATVDAGAQKDGPAALYSQNLLSPAASGPKPTLDQVQRLVDRVQQLAKQAVPVTVARSPSDVPGLKVPVGSKPSGALIGGQIYLFTENLKSAGDAYVTLFHEIFHLGLQKVIPAEDYAALLKQFVNNPLVAKFVHQWKASAEGLEKAATMPSAAYEALAAEEALAMVAEVLSVDGVGTRQMPAMARRMLTWFADVAEKIGFGSEFGNWVRNLTRTDAERFVSDMTRAVLSGPKNLTRAKAKYGTMAKQMTAQDRLRALEGADQTQTEAFKRWFGDSKVVDAEGKPLVVYHGTQRSFSAFAEERIGGGADATSNMGDFGDGFYFTKSSTDASGYAGSGDGASVMPVYLSIKNPIDAHKLMDIEGVDGMLQDPYPGESLRSLLEPMGYDGIIANGGEEIVAFRPEQIKSAIGNNGNFDPANADIRFRSADLGGRAGMADLASKARDELAGAAGAAIKSVTATNIKQRAGFKLTDYLGLGLQALGRRQIVDIYGDLVPLAEYNRLVQQMEADKNEGGAEADQLVTRWAKLDDEAKLADLMHDATLAQIDPAKPYVGGDDKAKYAMLAGRFNALSQEAKQVYTDTRDAYQAHHAKVRSAIKERIERSELKGPRKAELLKQMDDEFFAAVKGVYFPLARFGQYAVTVKGADGKVESVSRAETKAEAEALRNNLLSAFPRDKGFTVGRVMLSKDFIADRDAVGRGFMTELYQVLDKQDMDAAQRAELEDTLGQLYLSSLPDLSWAKHGIHRKGTPGFSQDARRAFAQNMFHGARYLAKLRYSDLMQDELSAMQKHVDDWREVEDFDQNSAQRVVTEMYHRHESLMNPKSNKLSTWATSLGFVFHLGLSPASAMVNLSQTALVAYPIMGAKWGFGKASAALLKASAEAAKGKNDITASLNADERAAYDEAVRAGTIDVTMAHDLAGIAQGEDAGVMWKIRPVMRWASFLFHHAERFNRQVTFVASYRLAREAGADQKAAFEQATKATYDGHFDYGAANRPRVMQGNVAKVLLLFKQYGQNMVYTLSRNAYQSIKGTDAEKAEARKVLAGLLTSHAMAAGVLGLPMVTTLLAAASMIGGDDDEPWDAKVALQNMLADALGQKPAEVLAHGLSRLTPWDISGRVGLDRLIFPDVQEGLEGQRLWESAATQALGPVGGIFGGALKGLDLISDGHYKLGLEAMLPAVLRQGVKSIRYGMDGAQDKGGVVIKDEVSMPAVVGQLLGFSPSEVRLAQEGKSAIYQQDKALEERRKELLSKAARATRLKDTETRADAMKEIERFNQKNPKLRITPLNVLQSVRNSQRRIDQAEGGVYLPKNRRDAIQAGRFALAESE